MCNKQSVCALWTRLCVSASAVRITHHLNSRENRVPLTSDLFFVRRWCIYFSLHQDRNVQTHLTRPTGTQMGAYTFSIYTMVGNQHCHLRCCFATGGRQGHVSSSGSTYCTFIIVKCSFWPTQRSYTEEVRRVTCWTSVKSNNNPIHTLFLHL